MKIRREEVARGCMNRRIVQYVRSSLLPVDLITSFRTSVFPLLLCLIRVLLIMMDLMNYHVNDDIIYNGWYGQNNIFFRFALLRIKAYSFNCLQIGTSEVSCHMQSCRS